MSNEFSSSGKKPDPVSKLAYSIDESCRVNSLRCNGFPVKKLLSSTSTSIDIDTPHGRGEREQSGSVVDVDESDVIR